MATSFTLKDDNPDKGTETISNPSPVIVTIITGLKDDNPDKGTETFLTVLNASSPYEC